MARLPKSFRSRTGFLTSLWSVLPALLVTTAAPAQEFSQWRNTQPLNFNTSTSGADVYYDIHNFPVAVALDDANFDFAQAKPDGSDIRFSSERDGGALPHAIEHWDATARRALVWVKVPTVRGRSTDQSIHMHWGNAAAPDASDSHEVFAVRDGFVGVWHFAEDGNSDPGGYRDATANAAHGTGQNLRRAPRSDTRLGPALELKHREQQWVIVDPEKRKMFDLTTRLTFSIWAKAYSYGNANAVNSTPGYETMISKGDDSWRLQMFGTRNRHNPPADLIEICIEKPPRVDLCVIGKTELVPGRWYHLVGVHEYPLVKLYVNGVLDHVDVLDVNWKSEDHPVGIGNQSQFPDRGRFWDGLLDEARVMDVPKDEFWIKLDYQTQREGQQFMTFGAAERRF